MYSKYGLTPKGFLFILCLACVACSTFLYFCSNGSEHNSKFSFENSQQEIIVKLKHDNSELMTNLVNETYRSWTLSEEIEGLKETLMEKRTVVAKISFYVPWAGSINKSGDPNVTAFGERPIPGGTCAVSRDLSWMYGRYIDIPGYGVFRVNDKMATHDPYTNKEITNQVDICLGKLSQVPKEGVFNNILVSIVDKK